MDPPCTTGSFVINIHNPDNGWITNNQSYFLGTHRQDDHIFAFSKHEGGFRAVVALSGRMPCILYGPPPPPAVPDHLYVEVQWSGGIVELRVEHQMIARSFSGSPIHRPPRQRMRDATRERIRDIGCTDDSRDSDSDDGDQGDEP